MAFPRSQRFSALLLLFPTIGYAGSIVIGFVGGFVAADNPIHYEVRLANRLGSGPGIQVRIFENHRGEAALQEVLHMLDTNDDGTLSEEEKCAARIVIYGHSWGASEAVTLARALARTQIPVLLTIQVDSVKKSGEDDAAIPANVAEAVNFYQSDGLLHGRAEIHAVDSSRTEILGNFQFRYKDKSVSLAGFSWFARTFMKPHIEIESDPAVWGQVESLIRLKLRLLPEN